MIKELNYYLDYNTVLEEILTKKGLFQKWYARVLQKNLEDKKIFLRGYILESNVPTMLEEVNQTNYSMNQLKDFMKN